MDEVACISGLLALLGVAIRWRDTRYRAVFLAVALCWIGNIGALANSGGNANYLTAPWLVLVLLVPAGLVVLERWSGSSLLLPAGVALAGGLLFIHQRQMLWTPSALPEPLDTSTLDRLTMLSDNPYLELRSRQPELLAPFFYHIVSRQNLWSPAPILERVDREHYDIVLIRGGDVGSRDEFYVLGFHGVTFWGSQMLRGLTAHYSVLCEVPGTLALVPKNRPAALHNEDVARVFGHSCHETSRLPHINPLDN